MLSHQSGTLQIAHLNCHSLLSHKDNVVTMFIAAQLDVLALTETWLDDTVVDSKILPCEPGLSLLWMDRNQCGRGVAFMMVSFIVRPGVQCRISVDRVVTLQQEIISDVLCLLPTI